MPEPRVVTYETRFAGLKIRHYANVYCVGVPFNPPRAASMPTMRVSCADAIRACRSYTTPRPACPC